MAYSEVNYHLISFVLPGYLFFVTGICPLFTIVVSLTCAANLSAASALIYAALVYCMQVKQHFETPVIRLKKGEMLRKTSYLTSKKSETLAQKSKTRPEKSKKPIEKSKKLPEKSKTRPEKSKKYR